MDNPIDLAKEVKPISIGNQNNLIENHSSAIAEAMQNHFGVPVSVSKSKTPYGISHYVKPQFNLDQSELPFTVRVSDHAAWVPRHHQIEHHVYPKENDHPKKFIDESIGAAEKYGKRIGIFSKDEFVPLTGDVYHPTFGTGKIIDSKPDVAKVDFGSKGIKNISSKFLQPINLSNSDITKTSGGRLAYQKGGKVEGSIWHEQDVIPHGDPQRDENLARHMEGSVTPPVLYHGTTAPNIKSFNVRSRGPKLMDGLGAHFGSVKAAHDRLKQNVGENVENANVMPIHVAIKNPPVKKDGSFMNESELQGFLSRVATNIGIPKSEHRGLAVYGGIKPHVYTKLKDELIRRGHDGLAYINSHEDRGSPSFVAFHQPQIKSATGNNGHFDPTNSDITKADGGPVEPAIHPARLIPGVHIREEDYGQPVFTGARHG